MVVKQTRAIVCGHLIYGPLKMAFTSKHQISNVIQIFVALKCFIPMHFCGNAYFFVYFKPLINKHI